jgi:hypothetical protein
MSRLQKAPSTPLLGLVGTPPAAPQDERVAAAYRTAGVEPPEPEPAPERKTKVGGWNGYKSNLEAFRAAWFHTQHTEGGVPSMSQLIESLIVAETKRRQDKYNGGEPFPPVPEGMVKHSRR